MRTPSPAADLPSGLKPPGLHRKGGRGKVRKSLLAEQDAAQALCPQSQETAQAPLQPLQEHSYRCSSPGTEKLQAFEFSQCWPQRGILWSLALDETYTPWAGTWKPRDGSSAEMLRLQLPGTAQQDVLGL